MLADYVDRQELHFQEALQIAKRIFFENSNKLYNLGIEYTELDPAASLKQVTSAEVEILKISHCMGPASSDILEPFSNPESRIPANLNLSDSVSFLKSQGIKFVRIAWVDFVNLTRYRVVPIEHFASVVGKEFTADSETPPSCQVAESGVSVVRVGIALGVRDSMPAGMTVSGDFDLRPEFSSMWKASFAPTHAYMMGRYFEKPHSGGGPSDICPRTILHRVVQYVSWLVIGLRTSLRYHLDVLNAS